MKNKLKGFTLVELLVTITIIAVLTGVGYSVTRSLREKAKMVVEVNAARNLIAGYLGHAAEHNGQVLIGNASKPNDVTNLDGVAVYGVEAERYPWRLAPSVPSVRGTLFFNGNEKTLDEDLGGYKATLRPNLGLNSTLVGGYFGSGSAPIKPSPRIVETYGKFYVSQLSDSDDPGGLIVFASARDGEKQTGYYQVWPPKATGAVWSTGDFKASEPSASFGFVDFRWGGKAVTARLGGNVELNTVDELRDMRHWSHQAARANDPNFTITSSR